MQDLNNMNLEEHKRTPKLFKKWREASDGSLKEKRAYYKLVQHTYRGTRSCDEKIQTAYQNLNDAELDLVSLKTLKKRFAI